MLVPACVRLRPLGRLWQYKGVHGIRERRSARACHGLKIGRKDMGWQLIPATAPE